MERTEGQKIEKSDNITNKTKGKSLSQLVIDMGYEWKKVAPYVAQALGVCSKDEYNKALDAYKNGTDKKTHIKYNIAMRELVSTKIEKGEKIDLGGLQDKALNGFSSSKQAIIKELVGPGTKYETFSSYMNGLEDDDKKKLNDISDEGLRIYITEQAEKGKVIASKPLNNEKVNSPTMEQIANGIQVENFATDLKTIKAKYPDVAWSTEEGNKIAYERMSPKQQKLLDEKYGGNKEKMYMALGIAEDMKIIEKNNLTKEMTKEEQQKYNALVKRYYEYNESIGLGEFLKETWGEFYEKVKNMVVEYVEETTASPIDGLKNDIVHNDEVTGYFDKYMATELVSDENKDDTYYAGLRKLYPTLDASIKEDPQIQELMNIKNPTDKEKETLQKLMEKKTKKTGAQDDLIKETKETVQEQAVTSCLDMLKIYMDIDLSAEENVLEQFKRAQSENKLVEKNGNDVVLNIDGKINGKNLKLYYNLTTGKLQQEEFMTRDKINGPFFIKDSKNGKVEIPGMQLPTFDDFIDGAKSLDYKDLIGEADDMNAYKEAVASTLKENVKKSGDRDMETEKMRFKRSVMKDMAMQEMFTFMEQDIENMPTQSFSSKNDNEVYVMFTLIYNSFLDYSMSELETFRKSIQDIDQKKKRYIINLSKEGVNDAVYALGLLGQADRTHTESVATIAKDAQDSKTQNIADQEKKSDQPYGYLQTYARFFSIFKNKTYARPIIDTIALEKFRYQLTQEVSTDQSYLERTNTTLAFDEFIDKSQQLPDVENIFPKDDIT